MLSVRGGNHGRPTCGNPPELAEKISAGGRYGWGRDNTHGFAIPSPMGSLIEKEKAFSKPVNFENESPSLTQSA